MSGDRHMVSREQYTLDLSPENPPAIEVAPGAEILVEAPSALGGVIRADGVPTERTASANPAAGPIALRRLGAGETMAVFVDEIKAVGYGLAGDTIYSPEGETLVFLDTLEVPMAPSIGTIGVAPATVAEATDNMRSGPHGGNMDCRDVAPGSVLFLKARVEGGRLGLGDVHLAMGDGEVEGQGVESAADVRIRLRIARATSVEWPWLVRHNEIMAIGAHCDYSAALHIAYESLIELCGELFGVDRATLRAMMAPAGSIKVRQTCCDVKTVRVSLPLYLFGHDEMSFLNMVLVTP